MSDDSVDFGPPGDVLFRDSRCDHVTVLPVLGIATRFETNSRSVRDLVEEAFGGWRRVADSVRPAGADAPRVRLVVHDGDERTGGHAPGHARVRHICPDATRLIAHSPGSVAVSDPGRGEAVAYVTAALVRDRAHFRGAMLEAITLALLSHFDRHPIHAAAVGRRGHAVLLAAPSGTGKSTLAYLAHAAGLDVLSDDRVWIQRVPTLRVWGWPDRMRLLPDATSHFPELARVGPPVVADGKRKLVVALASGPSGSRYTAERATVCVLARGRGRPALDRLDPGALYDALLDQVPAGFDRYPERHEAVVRALVAPGGWRLTLSDRPHEALPWLLRILDET